MIDPVSNIDPDGRACAPCVPVAIWALRAYKTYKSTKTVRKVTTAIPVVVGPEVAPTPIDDAVSGSDEKLQTDIAPTPTNDDLINSALGAEVKPLPGETSDQFTKRITRVCKQACQDQVGEEYDNGDDELPPVGGDLGDKIGQCTHTCIDNILDGVNDEDFE